MWFDEDDEEKNVEPMRETAVVPERWLLPNKKKCFWPTDFKERMLKLPVDTTWPIYSVEVRGTYDSYPKARLKLAKACETDNFESGFEKGGKTKRKRRKPKRYSSESSDQDSMEEMPSPPKITSRSLDSSVINFNSQDNEMSFRKQTVPVLEASGSSSGDKHLECELLKRRESSEISRLIVSNNQDAVHKRNHEGMHKSPERSMMECSRTSEGVKRCLKQILKNQEEIKMTLKAHSLILENICAHIGTESSPDAFSKPQGWPSEMPLSHYEAFNNFELFLEKRDNYNFAAKYISLKSYSSKGFEEMLRNICRFIISKELKLKLNWRGTENKKGLHGTKTASVISDAVMFKYPAMDSKMVAKIVSCWLRNNCTNNNSKKMEI
ncbi:uncharacterized protein LOC124153647 [Ischnura elegans]|uniref:uncharacterized protein LOC124153647 n=1 Tax=Ischnura elegans TaxID=197161 RepID=UPI001ED8ADE3|nr:uncharacterized protein LOC124153647 [Ischnura elegans]